LQHAWAEIEHDIRYKSKVDPNKELSQRFAALAGLVNIADREFDDIYLIDKVRRQSVRGSAQIAEIVDAAPEQLSKKENQAVVAVSLAALTSLAPNELASSPRFLIAQRKYAEAIRSYNKLIDAEPFQFAHFLGRARARFLNGDPQGALVDLARSDELSPNNPLSATVRSLITGEVLQESVRDHDNTPSFDSSQDVFKGNIDELTDEVEELLPQDPAQETFRGHQALETGDAHDALMHYVAAERIGYNPVYAVFNRAMARCLEKRYGLCLRTLEQLHPFPGSVLEFHVKMLQGVCILAEGGSATSVLPVISGNRKALADTVGYNYSRSVLRHLEPGLTKQADVWKKVCGVFFSAKSFDSAPR
jgi:tetratricopeptide (TPR) repeat protein